MSLAPQELENNASKYASEAIKFDSQGARGMAIANYQKAIDYYKEKGVSKLILQPKYMGSRCNTYRLKNNEQ